MSIKIQRIGLVLAAISYLFGVGCTQERQKPEKTEQTTETHLDRPYFQLGPEKFAALRDHVAALEIGESRDRSTVLLGPANREEMDGPKKGLDWKCRRLIYDVTVISELPGNVRDRAVALAFDRHDRLAQILSTVDGIPSRGDMNACR